MSWTVLVNAGDCLSFTETSCKCVCSSASVRRHSDSSSVDTRPVRVTCQATNGNDCSSHARLVSAHLFSSRSKLKHSVCDIFLLLRHEISSTTSDDVDYQRERVCLRIVGTFSLTLRGNVLKTVFQTRSRLRNSKMVSLLRNCGKISF